MVRVHSLREWDHFPGSAKRVEPANPEGSQDSTRNLHEVVLRRLLIADQHLLAGDAAPATEVLVCSAGFDERDALGHDRLDLPLLQELEERARVFPEPLGPAITELRDLEHADPLAVRKDVPSENEAPNR